MTAALMKGRAAGQEGRMSRTRLVRDLSQIADLVEMGFADRIDASGRAAIREMKLVGNLGPLLWLLALVDRLLGLDLGSGYVWRAEKRVVGNVSVYQGGRHPYLGRGSLIANVVVHPDYRRRGIARALMQASIEMIRHQGGKWVSLQVEADNDPAIDLYADMGFSRFETLEHWESTRAVVPLPPGDMRLWDVHLRRPAEIPAESALVFELARPGAMSWTRTLTQADVDTGLFSSLRGAAGPEHWILTPAFAPDRVVGALWVQRSSLEKPRLSLFLAPQLEDRAARQVLLRHALNQPALRGRPVRIEVTAGDPAVEDLLMQSGFRRVRALLQMRKMLDE